MNRRSGHVSRLSADSLGVFRGPDAVEARREPQAARGARRGRRHRPRPARHLPNDRSRAVERQSLRAALLWAGPTAAAAGVCGRRALRPRGRAAAGTRDRRHATDAWPAPDLVRGSSRKSPSSAAAATAPGLAGHGGGADDGGAGAALDGGGVRDRVRGRATATTHDGLRAPRVSRTLPGRPGAAALRHLLDELDPVHASRSTLEVKTRRLLVAHGLTDFTREFPLAWNGRALSLRLRASSAGGRSSRPTAAVGTTTPTDYEHDNEKWSVPGRHGYRIVFATWDKVTGRPARAPCRADDDARGVTRLGTSARRRCGSRRRAGVRERLRQDLHRDRRRRRRRRSNSPTSRRHVGSGRTRRAAR